MGYHLCLAAGGTKGGLSLEQGQSKIGQCPGIGTGQNGAWVTTHALAPGRAKLAGYWPCIGAGWRKKPIITYVLAQGGVISESLPVCLHWMRQVAGHHSCADSGWGNWQVLANVLVHGQSKWWVITHAFVQDGAIGRMLPMHLCRTGQMAGHHPCTGAGWSKWWVIAHVFVQGGANGRSLPKHKCRTGQMAGHHHVQVQGGASGGSSSVKRRSQSKVNQKSADFG